MEATALPPNAHLLHAMRAQLARRRRREKVRTVGLQLIAALGLLLAALAVVFPLDFLFDLSTTARILVVMVVLFVLYRWGVRRLWPAPIPHSDLEWALAVESSQTAPIPLVAAWQFASAAPPEGVSEQLVAAVISQAEAGSPRIDPLRGFHWSPLPRRGVVLIGGFLLAVALASLFPRYAQAFAGRLALQPVSYPTDTEIVAITVWSAGLPEETRQVKRAQSPLVFRAPRDEPVRIRVRATGAQPPRGQILQDATGNEGIALALQPTPRDDTARAAEYTGQLERLDARFTGSISLGDARPVPLEITPIPRPLLSIAFEVEPPAYATNNPAQPPEPGALAISVLPGSRVTLVVDAENKPMEEIAIVWREETSDVGPHNVQNEQTLSLRQDGSNPRRWRLSADGTPWEAIDRPLSYRIVARDADGLSPAKEITGKISLRADRPPRVTAQAAVRTVLPTARPTLEFAISDDFGLAAIALRGTLSRNGEVVSQRSEPLTLPAGQSTSHEQTIAVSLAEWSAQPGDEIHWVIEATDDRGRFPGQAGRSEPVKMTVTDRATLFSEMRDLDQTTAERLDAIIEQQLQIGNDE